MGLKDCLATAVAGKEISQADADRLGREFDRFRADAAQRSEITADAEAKRALAEMLKAETAEKKRRAALSLQSAKRIVADLDSYRDPRGRKDMGEATVALLEQDNPGGEGGVVPYSSVVGRHAAILGMAQARMESLLYTFGRSFWIGDGVPRLGVPFTDRTLVPQVSGRMNPAVLRNALRETFGEAAGDVAAKGLAATWMDTAEWLRQRFNAAGGSIGKLENWGMPQHHDPVALRHVGMAAWIDYITPLLDSNRMVHPLTGKPVSAGELEDVLADVFDAATTDGWDTRQATRQAFGRGALAGRHAEHRFLVFKNSDAWFKYQADFGGGSDIFGAMMGHINRMARDTAALEILGPNPDATVEWLKQMVEKAAAEKSLGRPAAFTGEGDPFARRDKYVALLDNLWGSIRGSLNTPVNGFWAGSLAGVRSFIGSTALGAAMLSSVGDTATSLITRRWAGIGGSVALDYFKALYPEKIGPVSMGGHAEQLRREAVAAGLILDSAAHVLHAQARYLGTLGGPQFAAFLGERVLHFSGLTAWTQAGKHAFGLAFMHEVAKSMGNGFDALHPLFRRKFAQYGIGPKEWDTIRAAAPHRIGAGTYILRPGEVSRLDERLADRYLEMIQTEMQYAVPEGTHRSRALLVNQNQPGTPAGEILRSFAQFKSFGAVFAMLHGRRIAAMLTGNEKPLGAAYAGALVISATLAGALAMQLKALSAGRDPRDMADPRFWAGAIAQGGGFGIFGDFLFADANRYGSSLASTVAGPTAERLGDFKDYVVSNAALLGGDLLAQAQGQPVDWGKLRHQWGSSTVRLLGQNIPGGNIWYLRLAWQRIVLDQLSYLADPDANKAFKRQQQFWQRNFGQGFWWQPGRNAPSRAPNMAAMAGG